MLNGPEDRASPADAHNPFTDLPEVAVNRGSYHAPEVVLTDYPEVVTAKPNLEPEKYYTTTGEHVLPSPIPVTNDADGQKRPKIMGIPRKRFFIICLVVFIICVCAIAIPVAITTTRKSSASQADLLDPTPTGMPTGTRPPGPSISLGPSAIQLAEKPTIAATNYTSDGITRLYVYSQASNHSLLASVWDSRNKTWATLDLTTILDATDPKLALSFIPNTPIAAYAYMNPTFQMRVYGLVAGNSIREIVCTNPTLQTSWVPGRLGFDTFLSTAEGSKLAALRPQCGTGDDCRNRFPHMAVAYESDAGQLMVAKSPQFRALSLPEAPARGSEIGLAAVMKKDNVSDLRWHLMYRAKEGRLADWTSERSLEDWKASTRDIAVAQTPSQSLTTFTFDLANIMALTVPPKSSSDAGNGRTATVSVVNNKIKGYPKTGTLAVEETVPEGAIPDNAPFDSLAGSAERRVYAAIGGRIHEWQFDFVDELAVTWSYVGPVT